MVTGFMIHKALAQLALRYEQAAYMPESHVGYHERTSYITAYEP